MKMDLDKAKYPLIIENSPIEFALMGPLGRHRGVLVKSNGASLDLIGYDNPSIDKFTTRHAVEVANRDPFFRLIYGFFASDAIYALRSYGATSPNNSEKKSHFSFVWRGLSSPTDFIKLEEQFNELSIDLDEALINNAPSEVEWTISGLITACGMVQRRAKVRKSGMRFILAAYGAIGLIMTLVIIIKNSKF